MVMALAFVVLAPAAAFLNGGKRLLAQSSKRSAARLIAGVSNAQTIVQNLYVNRPVTSAAMVGSTAPLRDFDPLGFSKDKTERQLNRLRECELKHGRVSMAALLGIIVEPRFHPLADSCHITKVSDPFAAGLVRHVSMPHLLCCRIGAQLRG